MTGKKHKLLLPSYDERVDLPLAESQVPAGFPSPADDYIQNHLDLNEPLILHGESLYTNTGGHTHCAPNK